MRVNIEDLAVALMGLLAILTRNRVARAQTAIILRLVGEKFAREEQMLKFYRAMGIVVGVTFIVSAVLRHL